MNNQTYHFANNTKHISHIISHIEHNIFPIINPYAMRPWNHGHKHYDFPEMRAQYMGPQLGSLLCSFIRTPFHFIHGSV